MIRIPCEATSIMESIPGDTVGGSEIQFTTWDGAKTL